MRGGRREDAILRRLHHALPHSAMETALCSHSTNCYRSGIPNFRHCHRCYWSLHCCHRRRCWSSRLLHLSQGLCQRLPWNWYCLDHGCHLLGSSGRGLHCPCWKLGILSDCLLYRGWSCHLDLGCQKTSCCGWRAGRTQVLQDLSSSFGCSMSPSPLWRPMALSNLDSKSRFSHNTLHINLATRKYSSSAPASDSGHLVVIQTQKRLKQNKT